MSDPSDDFILTLEGIGKRFPGVVALRDVSMQIGRGEGHILLGENGAGKSTLINLLGGVFKPDDGHIVFDGENYSPNSPLEAFKAGIRVIHQELHPLSNLTVAENLLFEHLPRRYGLVNYREMNKRAAELLAEVGLDVAPTTPANRLSVAQLQLLEIAKALCYESKLLVLDEPTATLTSREVDRLFEILKRLKARGVTTLYISHRLEEIFEVGDNVTVLRDGQHVITRPLPGLAIPDIVELMVGRTLSDHGVFRSDSAVFGEALGVSGLRVTRNSPELSFSVGKGEIVGIAGLVGSGRTEAVRAIFGADDKAAGEIRIDGKEVEINSPKDAVAAGLCLATEDRKLQGLMLDMSCAENTTITDLGKISRNGLIRQRVEEDRSQRLVHELHIKTPSIHQAVRTFSGGNQQKVVIAKWLFRGPKVLIFDEPTRGIDVGAKAEIYELLWKFAAEGKGVLVVSSDLPELMGICHRMIVFSDGKIAGEISRDQFDESRILSLAYKEYSRVRQH
ncbi:sugar ABC transporter ATP-binding protein [Rhizobium leucaenae]|uniref:Ribose transport system ATP-binding protein n=1 Tax=Rhizobium leucaenae TaxID=29450 RepID=A0A7W6ZYE8_9HYPH|nr:sugar ABC transporter ATP-binding protein [Rhizobium leucaenae]MBB4571073.1 ribose transport system ATP-binding protein [Rhizobium leucaenae]MBB6304167.1 ribose transport system ATP-binding protein [Rhizobium leucaenae]